jgi:hypothetical protein
MHQDATVATAATKQASTIFVLRNSRADDVIETVVRVKNLPERDFKTDFAAALKRDRASDDATSQADIDGVLDGALPGDRDIERLTFQETDI